MKTTFVLHNEIICITFVLMFILLFLMDLQCSYVTYHIYFLSQSAFMILIDAFVDVEWY